MNPIWTQNTFNQNKENLNSTQTQNRFRKENCQIRH